MYEFDGTLARGSSLNYCSNCRRHLNGALSCPGCGAAVGPDVQQVQDVRSTVRMPRVAPWSGRIEPIKPIIIKPEDVKGIGRAPDRVSDTASDHEPVEADTAEQSAVDDSRPGEKARSWRKLGLAATSGCAGIVLCVFLLISNMSGGGSSHRGAGAGSVANPHPASVTASPIAAMTLPQVATSGPTAAQTASPTLTATPTPSQSATLATTAPATSTPLPTSTQRHTTAPTPTASPSKSACWLLCFG